MFLNNYRFLRFFLLTFVFTVLGVWVFHSSQEKSQVVKGKWLIAHTPENARLVEQAREFAKNVFERTQGKLQFELIFPPPKVRDGNNFSVAVDTMLAGEADVSQIGIGALATLDDKFQILDMPYLFNNHDHAARVLDGDIGQRIRDNFLASNKEIRSLDFTYSGGYRIFVSNKPIRSAEDLAGNRILSYRKKSLFESPEAPPEDEGVRKLTQKVFGFKLISPTNIENMSSVLDFFRRGDISIAEDHFSHFTRVFKKFGIVPNKMHYFWETNHSLFMTSIVVREKFFQSLSPEAQKILVEESRILALKEREDSIQVDAYAKTWLINSGYDVSVPSRSEKKKLEKMVEPVYSQFKEKLGADIIEKIQELGNRMEISAK